jgi:O-antigen ligase
VIASGLILAIATIPLASDVTIQRFEAAVGLRADTERVSGIDASTSARIELLKDSLRLTLRNPILGVGPGMFMVAQNTMSVEEGHPMGSWHGTHNTYTQFSSEGGLPAMALFVFILYRCVKGIRRADILNRQTPSDRQGEVRTICLLLQGLWAVYIVSFFFFHLVTSNFLPALIGLTMAASVAIESGISKIRAQAELPGPNVSVQKPRVSGPRAWGHLAQR